MIFKRLKKKHADLLKSHHYTYKIYSLTTKKKCIRKRKMERNNEWLHPMDFIERQIYIDVDRLE